VASAADGRGVGGVWAWHRPTGRGWRRAVAWRRGTEGQGRMSRGFREDDEGADSGTRVGNGHSSIFFARVEPGRSTLLDPLLAPPLLPGEHGCPSHMFVCTSI
jgi:hypothetical protein